MIHFHYKEKSFDFHSKGGDLPTLSPILIPWPFQARLVVPSEGCVALAEMWRFSNVLRLCCHFKSSRKLPGLTAHTVSSQRSGFQEYELLTSITVDTVAVHSMQWAGPGLSTGSHVERKEGLPTPHRPPTPTVDSLVTRNGPPNKNQTNQIIPDSSPWDEGTKQLVEMAPRGRVVLFVSPSTPFFLDALGFCHGDLKVSAQKSYVLNQDFAFNHLSKRKRASPAHVSFKTVNCFSILGFLPCLVQVAIIVKINEN